MFVDRARWWRWWSEDTVRGSRSSDYLKRALGTGCPIIRLFHPTVVCSLTDLFDQPTFDVLVIHRSALSLATWHCPFGSIHNQHHRYLTIGINQASRSGCAVHSMFQCQTFGQCLCAIGMVSTLKLIPNDSVQTVSMSMLIVCPSCLISFNSKQSQPSDSCN